MFGTMTVAPIVDLRDAPDNVGGSLDGAVASLLNAIEHPTVAKWVQSPKILFVFLVVSGDPESGPFYIYDRLSKIWFWLDFEDDNFGGYTVKDFDRMMCECWFLDVIERPHLLSSKDRWFVQTGLRPQRIGRVVDAAMKKSGWKNQVLASTNALST